MTQPFPRNAGVSLATPFIKSRVQEQNGRAKPQLSLDSVVITKPLLYTESSPRSPRTGLPIYSRFTSRSSRWKSRRTIMKAQISGPAPKGIGIERLEDTVKVVTNWDGLSMDPELWYPDGNCFVHLYARDSTASPLWGPAFLIPLEILVGLDCIPLLERFLTGNNGSCISTLKNNFGKERSNFEATTGRFDLYIPPPPTVEGKQPLLYRTATRNFFAWICGKPLVGESLGQALVGLLNSMREFRGLNVDNVEDILDYMEEGGYADFGNSPVHTLATLYFAEHFQFDHIYVDAFAHAVGMYDQVVNCQEYKSISSTSRSLIARAHSELQTRLASTSTALSNFLTDELSPTHLGLSQASRTHLDRFRDFLNSYWVSALGSYPPPNNNGSGFQSQVLLRMRAEFRELYAYLVDESFTASDCSPKAAQGGICVLQSVQAFDERLGYESLLHPLPLLPEAEHNPIQPHSTRTRSLSLRSPTLSRSFSWTRPSSPKQDARLLALAALSKASNHYKPVLLEAPLVKAYRDFETSCILAPKEDKQTRISSAAARKVRWILIYATLQTLRAATDIPQQVRTTLSVPYHLSAVLPHLPWPASIRPSLVSLDTTLYVASSTSSSPSSSTTAYTPSTTPLSTPIEPDIDYTLITRSPTSVPTRPPRPRRQSLPTTLARSLSQRGTLRRAISVMSRKPTRRSSAPTQRPATSGNDSCAATRRSLEEAAWAKQVELNQIDQEPDSFGQLCTGGGDDAEATKRWSGSTAHEDEEAKSEAKRRHGRIKSLATLGALLDGVVEERVYFSIEDFPKDGKRAGNEFETRRPTVGVAM